MKYKKIKILAKITIWEYDTGHRTRPLIKILASFSWLALISHLAERSSDVAAGSVVVQILLIEIRL